MDNTIRELINYVDLLCNAMAETPIGCEGCPIYNDDKIDKEEDFICPVRDLINFLNLRG